MEPTTPSQKRDPLQTLLWAIHTKPIQVFGRTIFSLAVLAASVGILFYLGEKETASRKQGRSSELLTVETAPAESHQTGIDFEVDGVVIPYREVVVSTEVSGRVVYKSDNCRQGRFVKEGECLFRIDPANYQLDVQRLEAALEQSQASIDECDVEIRNLIDQIVLAKEQVAIQQRELKRYESVKDPGVYSESEIDAARNGELAARNSLQQLESQHRLKKVSKTRLQTVSNSSKVQLERAKLDLKRTEVCAPLSGIVTKYNVEQDSYLQAGTTAVTIQDTTRLEIRCSLHMQQVGWLWQTAHLPQPSPAGSENFSSEGSASEKLLSEKNAIEKSSTEAYRLPGIPVTVRYRLDNLCWAWHGTLTSYDGSSVDEITRMMPCRVTVENPLITHTEPTADCQTTAQSIQPVGKAPPTLMSGMFVEVQIHSTPSIPLLRFKETALLPGNQVWTATGGVLKRHQVQVAQLEKDEVVVYAEGADMQPGDQVVISPLAMPIEGMKVKLMEKPAGK